MNPDTLLTEHDRFFSKVDASGDCWEWAASQDDKGYGQIRWGGTTKKAHLVMWALLVGEIPSGLQIDHVCRIRHCVNPDHLEPVTPKENTRRGAFGPGKKQTQRLSSHCPHGHEYTPENTRTDHRQRYCRTCDRDKARRYRERKRNEQRHP